MDNMFRRVYLVVALKQTQDSVMCLQSLAAAKKQNKTARYDDAATWQ